MPPPTTLLPFPSVRQLPAGSYDRLPVTRLGIRSLNPDPFVGGPAGFRHLTIGRQGGSDLCRGICGLLPATAFADGHILPHEQTLPARLKVQTDVYRRDRGAIGKPVLLTTPSLAGWWATAGRSHQPTGPTLQYTGVNQDYLLREYAPRPGGGAPLPALPHPLVIADGHHRAATFARLATARQDAAFAHVPVVIVGADELRIGTFLRVIQQLDLPPAELERRLAPFFELRPLDQARIPQRSGEWLLSRRGRHRSLRRRGGPAPATTDAGWLNQTVLPTVFGITDTRNDPRFLSLDPPPRPGGVLAIPDELYDPILLLGFPLTREAFFAEVGAGRTLPPKSTRFEPRVPSGLLVWAPPE